MMKVIWSSGVTIHSKASCHSFASLLRVYHYITLIAFPFKQSLWRYWIVSVVHTIAVWEIGVTPPLVDLVLPHP